MSFLLKDTIHQSLAETVYNEILSRRSNYHYFIGNIIEWADENNPPTPEVTQDYEYNTRNSIIAVKKINIKDASLVVPRRNWVTGTVYDQFDGDYSASYPASSGATKLKDSTLVNGVVAGVKGDFQLLEIPYGRYFMKINFT